MTNAEIYLEAAELMDAGYFLHSCIAITRAVDSHMLSWREVPEVQLYQGMMLSGGAVNKLNDMSWEDARELRVLLLLMMAAVVEEEEGV